MSMPAGIGAVDLMIGFPSVEPARKYDAVRRLTRDAGSAAMTFPAEYMFKDGPTTSTRAPIRSRSAGRDGPSRGRGRPGRLRAARSPGGRCRSTPTGSSPASRSTPTTSPGGARDPAHDEHDIKAVTTFPAGCNPQVPVSDRRYYPVFQTCIDLDIPIVLNAGVPGPRVPVGVPGRHATSTRSATTSPSCAS